MKKYLLAFVTALVLCVPALADNEVYFAADEFVATNGETTFTASGTDVSFFVWFDNSFYNRLYAISESSTTIEFDESTINCDISFGSYYRSTALTVIGDSYTTTPPITYFGRGTTDVEIQAAYADFLANPPTPTPSIASSFTLPRGNVLYFQVATEQDVYFTSYMDTLSNIINFNSATYGAWGDTGQRYGEAAALPTAGTVFPLLSQSPIAWQKDSSTNILGQTKVGLATKHCIVGQWYCLYNPNANHIEGADPYNASPGASVVIQGAFSQIKVYPVNQKLSVVDGDLYSGSNDDFDSYYDGTIDQDGTVTWTNQDGNIEAPAAGGQNFEDGPKSATSLLEGIRVTLETVVHELQTLFTFGYSAIQSLVGIMSDFVSVFSGLYTWLPAEVYSALMSAVVVAIVIGVFKVFL